MRRILKILLCAFLLLQPMFICAFETDQYNLPKVPLADIGDEVSQYVEITLNQIIAETNAKIVVAQNCLDKKSRLGCESDEKEAAKLKYLRSDQAIADAIYKRLGAGFITTTKIGSWLSEHKFEHEPARYKTSYQNSIYFAVPTNYFTLSPTINLYGAQFGTDKIAHIFQQGYTYYKKYNQALAKGLTQEEATQKAIKWGKFSEKTFYGTLVSGVYSNADLVANYAGLKFYQNLTHEVKIGEITNQPLLTFENGIWKLNQINRVSLLKPFVSNHFNEAYNPSIYMFGLRSFVRRNVRKNACSEWRRTFPNLSQNDFDAISERLKLWYGEDYGYQESNKFITISNTCFEK